MRDLTGLIVMGQGEVMQWMRANVNTTQVKAVTKVKNGEVVDSYNKLNDRDAMALAMKFYGALEGRLFLIGNYVMNEGNHELDDFILKHELVRLARQCVNIVPNKTALDFANNKLEIL